MALFTSPTHTVFGSITRSPGSTKPPSRNAFIHPNKIMNRRYSWRNTASQTTPHNLYQFIYQMKWIYRSTGKGDEKKRIHRLRAKPQRGPQREAYQPPGTPAITPTEPNGIPLHAQPTPRTPQTPCSLFPPEKKPQQTETCDEV